MKSSFLASGTACAAAVITLLLAGCRLARIDAPAVPEVETGPAFPAVGEMPLRQQWWTVWEDEALDRVVDRSLSENLSLLSAWYRLEQARAIADRSGALSRPTVSATLTAESTIQDQHMRELSTRGKGRGSISAGYEVDLWGRIEAAQDAAEWDVKASQADLHTAAITVSSNVVQVWFELVAARGQKQLTEKQLKVNQDYLELVSMRFRRGEVPVTDVLQQRKLIENRRGTLSQIESQIVKLETQLSVLLGESPDTLVFSPSKQLPDLPPLPKAGVPAELLLRRPDVAAAWARLKAAASRYVETEADKYPSLNLSINAQTSAEKLKQVLDSWVTTLAANLAAPLLDGGRRGAEARRALAAYHERVAGYRQTVLDALKEVYDALEAERHQVAYIQSLDKQLALSQSSLDQILTRYRKGAMPYTRYLTAVLDRQQLQVTRLNAKRDLIVNRIALYRAVAGRLELPELVHSANE